ncbi:MAG: XisI protein [Bacteroidia bacterium]
MDKLRTYQNYIRTLLQRHAGYKPKNLDVETQIIFDTENNHFLLMDIGWDKDRFFHDCVFHLDIKDGKIWLQQNWTDADIAGELVDMGVPKSDIVIGFQPPKVRAFTGYAVA